MLRFLFLVSCLSGSLYSSACSCIGEQTISEEFKHSDLVVSAKIISRQKIKIWSDTSFVKWNYKPGVDTVTFEKYRFEEEIYGFHQLEYTLVVESAFKGAKSGDTLKIRTGFGHGDCGFEFQVGKQYLIYAISEHSVKYSQEKLGRSKKELKGIFNTDRCRRTRSIESAGDDLNYLKSN